MALLPSGLKWQVTVADGGAWMNIANAIGSTRAQLYAANGISSYRPLVIGEKINVPFD
jgi:hypothetical protein